MASDNGVLGLNEVPGAGTYEDYYNQYMNRPTIKFQKNLARIGNHLAPVILGTGLGALTGGATGGFDLDKVNKRTKLGAGIGAGAGIIASALLHGYIKELTDRIGEDEAWRYAAMRSGKLDPSKTLV